MLHENHEPRNETRNRRDYETQATMAEWSLYDMLDGILCVLRNHVDRMKEARQMGEEGMTVEEMARDENRQRVRDRRS